MATAFSEQERAAISAQLRAAALRCAATLGMRKTTVDELAREAGISKGTFYHFYASKESLFLNMLEGLHDEMYGSAERILDARRDLPIRRRTALAIGEVFRVMEARDMMGFMRDDLPVLLRRVSPEELAAHYHSDDERIRSLIGKAGVKLSVGMDTACAVVSVLLMSLIDRERVGAAYDAALLLLVEGACDRLLA